MHAHRPDRGKVSILVVDDESSILELLREYLRARGHAVETAANGERALELIEDQAFDVVLTDMKMPGIGGLDLLAKLREHPLPVATILMTGYGTIDSAIRAMKDGAHDYLLKPFKLREVHAAITRAVERIRLERETVRLRQAVSLYQAVHAMEDATALPDIYALLSEVALREFGGIGALVAFEEPEAGEWVEFLRTHRAPFRGHDLRALAARVRGEPTADARLWFRADGDPVLVAGMRAQLSPRGSSHVVGLVAVARPSLLSPEAVSALEVYASIVGDALSRQTLAARLRAHEGEPDRRFPGRTTTDPDAHVLRVAALVEATARTVGLAPDQVQLASCTARVHDHARWGLGLRDLLDGAPLEPGSLVDREISPELLEDARPILLDLHEHHDGSGSPRGRSGESIHPVAQLVAVADRYDMLTEARAFAPRLGPEEAADALRSETGTRFRSDVVESFLDTVEAGALET